MPPRHDNDFMDSDSDISLPDGDITRSKTKSKKLGDKRKKDKGKTKPAMDAVSFLRKHALVA
jgi:hypothetical protein